MHGTMPAKPHAALPISRVRFKNTLFARLEGNGRGRVACSAYASNLIAGAARRRCFDEIDAPDRKQQREGWRESIQAQFRGSVGNFKHSHDLEIPVVRIYCGGIGNGVDGSRHH